LIAAAVMLLGLALVTFGAWLVYEPAGFLVCGLALLAGGWFYVRGARVTA
jgi:glucose dehydrogenase